ncbi:hypothetical protein [Acanthopleuribacter pedis]|uniref:Uncharacterized protein n=1 Tax=Acanthopleuribacter pedis TaxID=442870 RepID=A0A8J7Q4M3_9BACT|nr:hypothetical protein [Acanthopleuribacter pedis]MBO1317701.1 hypothetical protein [Acanthopleuribacter pedis]
MTLPYGDPNNLGTPRLFRARRPFFAAGREQRGNGDQQHTTPNPYP